MENVIDEFCPDCGKYGEHSNYECEILRKKSMYKIYITLEKENNKVERVVAATNSDQLLSIDFNRHIEEIKENLEQIKEKESNLSEKVDLAADDDALRISKSIRELGDNPY